MADLLTEDLISFDPLSEVTRKERRALLGISVVGVALVKVPLVPEKFATFGIEFSRPNQSTFLAIYALVVLYFLGAFLIYAFTDYVAWRRERVRRHHEYSRQVVASQVALGEAGMSMLAEKRDRRVKLSQGIDKDLSYLGLASYDVAEFAAKFRALFEFGVPIAFALYTIGVLLSFSGNANVL